MLCEYCGEPMPVWWNTGTTAYRCKNKNCTDPEYKNNTKTRTLQYPPP
ncbi:MAG: hypothetical protein DDT40_00833 [candidate division WS2 bacterium]|nr:hypothetical protein [Candidatus Psychracetigena formicireducens]